MTASTPTIGAYQPSPTIGAWQGAAPTGYQLIADPGSYTISGQDVDLLHDRNIPIESGSYTITGQDVDLVYSFGFILSADPGSYTISGQDVDLLHNRVLPVEPGSYAITGRDIDLIHTQILEPGSYTISGQPVDLLHNKKVGAGAGSYAITGQDVTLTFTQNPNKAPFLYYIFTLTGDADGTTDIEIPISSFQARLRSGDPTYLSVVIPGMDQAAAINARPNGLLKVDAAYKTGDIWTQRKTIIQANLEDIRIDQGTTNISITLTGHKQKTYTAKAITLTGQTYKNSINGEIRYRFAEPEVELNPGDTVTVETDTYVANVISYYVKAKTGGIETQMEVSES